MTTDDLVTLASQLLVMLRGVRPEQIADLTLRERLEVCHDLRDIGVKRAEWARDGASQDELAQMDAEIMQLGDRLLQLCAASQGNGRVN